jgi:hypothetical protein
MEDKWEKVEDLTDIIRKLNSDNLFLFDIIKGLGILIEELEEKIKELPPSESELKDLIDELKEEYRLTDEICNR